MTKQGRLFLALDFPKKDDALAMLEKVGKSIDGIKIGLEAYYSWSKHDLKEIHQATQDYQIHTMLDLKLHDIPRTVERATKAVFDIQPKYLTVHASGGNAMLKSALKATEDQKTDIVAVTLLTSLDEEDTRALGFLSPQDSVLRFARLAFEAGVRWLVCSLGDVAKIKKELPEMQCIVPGVRLTPSKDDQKRIGLVTAENASLAEIFVVGRPITQSKDPAQEVQKWKTLLDGISSHA